MHEGAAAQDAAANVFGSLTTTKRPTGHCQDTSEEEHEL